MRRLSSIILALLFSVVLNAQKSPHGNSFRANCDDCHKTESWKVDLKTLVYDHDATQFPLIGQHRDVSCMDCHKTLEFGNIQKECNACHIDIHEQTVGTDCQKCHTPDSWIVTNITQIHQQSRFPLIGPHTVADCKDCHTNLASASLPSASLLRFDQLGTDCYDCHRANYDNTTKPNHVQSNYSTNCTECHNINAFTWEGAGVNHNFFPLTGGHALDDCKTCHTSGSYTKIPAECITCHQADYNSTSNPGHTSLNFTTNCKECHSLDPGWKPASYRDHDSRSFPIYSGRHDGEWDNCSDCHKNQDNYADFTCIDCHAHSNKNRIDNDHDGVNGYEYSKTSCYACHPTGNSNGSFNHNNTGFPLTGAHNTTKCSECHTNGYSGTSNVCSACHINDYNQTNDPNHKIANGKFTEDCASCHTTEPGWKPATYPAHSNLEGAHLPIANSCADCHKGNYSTIPSSCNDCHNGDYTQTTNPSHSAAQFPVTCADCHSQSAWKPATFNHDGQYFPIYSGKHNGEWINCADCHTNTGNYTLFSCTDCHDHNQATTNSQHQGVSGYIYNSTACFECHPTGTAEGSFDHNSAGFPLTGGHANADCASCHTNGYTGTSKVCSDCHINNFNQATNPNHVSLNLSHECSTCHTLAPGWSPAGFPDHNSFYVITGAHTAIANNCTECHNGNYNNTPNTCFGCHSADYNQSNDPNHASAQFPTTCEDCHTQSVWVPSTFNHDGQYFPIYSGKHKGEWNTCSDCHTNSGNYAVYTCTTACHPQSSTNNEHQGVSGYSYSSTACLNCHPNGSGDKSINNSIFRSN